MPQLQDQGPRFVAERIGEHRARTPEGYLIALGVPIARTGIQQYKSSELQLDGPERLIDVERPFNEVFAPAAVLSFEGKTITSPHPPSFLNTQNENLFHRGHAQNIRKGPKLPDGNQALIADLVFKDQDLIQQVESELRKEISAGYEYVLEPTSDPDKYVMRNIRGNHVAVVSSGRAGEHVRVLDSKEEEPANMAESAEVGILKKAIDYLSSLGWAPKKADSDSKATDEKKDAIGAIELNEQYNHEALERAERRNTDMKLKTKAKDEELEQEEKGAAPPDKTKEQGDEDEEETKKEKSEDADEEEKKAEDSTPLLAKDARRLRSALDRMTDALLANTAARKAADEDEEEKEEKKEKSEDVDEDKEKEEEKEAEDSDLIPVLTLEKKERPKNPIPGADAIIDACKQMKSVVAKSGDRKAIDALNKIWRTANKAVDAGDDSPYSALATRGDGSKPEEVRNAEGRRLATGDSKQEQHSQNFVESTKKFLGKNPGMVAEGGK